MFMYCTRGMMELTASVCNLHHSKSLSDSRWMNTIPDTRCLVAVMFMHCVRGMMEELNARV